MTGSSWDGPLVIGRRWYVLIKKKKILVRSRSQQNMTTINARDLGTGITLPSPLPACPPTSCPVCKPCWVSRPLTFPVLCLCSRVILPHWGWWWRRKVKNWSWHFKKTSKSSSYLRLHIHIRPTSLQASSPLKGYERFGEMTSGCWFIPWKVVWIWKDSSTFTYGVNNDQMCCTSASICCAHGCSTSDD